MGKVTDPFKINLHLRGNILGQHLDTGFLRFNRDEYPTEIKAKNFIGKEIEKCFGKATICAKW